LALLVAPYYTPLVNDTEVTQVRPPPPIPPDLHPGSVVGTFRLDALIASGASSEIYEGLNLVANKRCAVKLFRRHLELDLVHFGRYVHEVKRLSGIDHPNIAEVFSFANADGRAFAVMERLEGATLRALLQQQGQLSRRSLLPLLRGMCQGLAAAHGMGVVHQHLHPGQVLIQWGGAGDPVVKLLDFGVHHLLVGIKEESGLERRAEHAAFLAPEQIKGLPADSRTDVYAVSAMLYQMVTGRPPLLGDTYAATLDQHLNESPLPPSRHTAVSTDLEEMILRGLEKDPRRRVPSMEALLATLDPTSASAPHPLLGKSGRLAAIPSSREISLTAGEAPAGDESLPPSGVPPLPLAARDSDPLQVPKRRSWLFVLLGVAAVGFLGVVAYVFLGERDDKPVVKRATAPRSAARPPAPPSPSARFAKPRGLEPSIAKRDHPVLRHTAGFGTLQVTSKDPSAQVFVDGYFKGQGKVVTLQSLVVGTHRIHIVVAGRKSPHRDVQLKPGDRLTVDF
jgi:serine/threonine protein kinase